MNQEKKDYSKYLEVGIEKFYEIAVTMKNNSFMLVAQWATELNQFFEIYACFRVEGEFLIVKTQVSKEKPEFPSLSKLFLSALRFERQIYSLMGILPVGHIDLRPWIKFEDWPIDAWPLRKDFSEKKILKRVSGDYNWIQAQGEGVSEIPVGPVHAGIIEPGHFRFQAVGETIINLEERFGYTHKGIEKRFESLDWLTACKLAGRVSGDSTVAHSLAYCRALESMLNFILPKRAAWLRAIFLERERIINHLGDIGAICNDAAFSIMLVQFMRLKEKLLRTNYQLFGHRFMMDCIIPGGVSVNILEDGVKQIYKELKELEKDFEGLVKIYDGSPSLEDRLRETGILSKEIANVHGVVGFVARGSGINNDSRSLYPFLPYTQIDVNVPIYIQGDINSRVWVRIDEIRESIRIIRLLLDSIPDTEIESMCKLPSKQVTGFSVVEGFRGEIMYWLQSTETGSINRCMIRDASSLNWLALERAVMNNIVADFPLINKSFNSSYSGHDL